MMTAFTTLLRQRLAAELVLLAEALADAATVALRLARWLADAALRLDGTYR
jgi:hypothetical protein